MTMPLSGEVRLIQQLAHQEAVRRMNAEVTAAHLVLGLSWVETGGAADILHHLFGSVAVLREGTQAAVGQLPTYSDAPWMSGIWPKSPGWQYAVGLAVRAAEAEGAEFVGSEHLLLGLTRTSEEPATTLLRSFGIMDSVVSDHWWVIREGSTSVRGKS